MLSRRKEAFKAEICRGWYGLKYFRKQCFVQGRKECEVLRGEGVGCHWFSRSGWKGLGWKILSKGEAGAQTQKAPVTLRFGPKGWELSLVREVLTFTAPMQVSAVKAKPSRCFNPSLPYIFPNHEDGRSKEYVLSLWLVDNRYSTYDYIMAKKLGFSWY